MNAHIIHTHAHMFTHTHKYTNVHTHIERCTYVSTPNTHTKDKYKLKCRHRVILYYIKSIPPFNMIDPSL